MTANLSHSEPAGNITHVLLDADGVVQRLPGGWQVALAPVVPDPAALFARLARDEEACIRGEGPFRPVLASHLEALGVTTPAQEVYDAVWANIAVDRRVIELVGELRASGIGCHLATNQNPERAEYMRSGIGHDEVFDSSFYSCEIGLAKPDPAYFRHVLDALDATPAQVAFVDDSERNVQAARELGLAAEQWHTSDGITRLRELLAGRGMTL
ncbi:MAG: HAD-IA family hydrolase [Nocardioides sp.]|nr:HAD-IA family hydrolase [Nocardioides sp.]